MKSLVVFLFCCYLSVVAAREIRVAAASDLQFALGEVIAAFQEEHPDYQVSASFGSSGNLYAQITQGAPFDLYFSASSEYTENLELSELIEPGSRSLYAVGRLVIWVSDTLDLDVATLQQKVLLEATISNIAIANPDHAPYGKAAVDYLNNTGLYAEVQSKLLYGENISQAAQLALQASGAGMIALSIAVNPTMQAAGKYWLIPLDDHLRLDQEMVILKNQARAEVRAFYDFVRGDTAKAILKRYGFIIP